MTGRRFWAALFLLIAGPFVAAASGEWRLKEKEALQEEWRLTFEHTGDQRRVVLRLRPPSKAISPPGRAGKWFVLYEGSSEPSGFKDILGAFNKEMADLPPPVWDQRWDRVTADGKFVANAPRKSGNGPGPHPAMKRQWILWLTFLGLGLAWWRLPWPAPRRLLLGIWATWPVLTGSGFLCGRWMIHRLETPGGGNVVTSVKPLDAIAVSGSPGYASAWRSDGPKTSGISQGTVWIFGESTAQGVPFGEDWSLGAWASKVCPSHTFQNAAIGGMTSDSWLAAAAPVARAARKGDVWVLAGGHNDHLGPIPGPPEKWRWFLWLPGAKHLVYPTAQILADQLMAKFSKKRPPELPWGQTLFAFDPPKENKLSWNLKAWGRKARQAGAQVIVLELPGCAQCGERFPMLDPKPAPPWASRGTRHTKPLMDHLRGLAKTEGWRFLPLPERLAWQERGLRDRLTVDNHHPVLEVQWRMGRRLAGAVPGCGFKDNPAEAFEPWRIVAPEDYLRRLAQGLWLGQDNRRKPAGVAWLKRLKLREVDEAFAAGGGTP